MSNYCRRFLEKEPDMLSEWKNLHQSNSKSNKNNSEVVMQKKKLKTNNNKNDINPTINKDNKVAGEVIEKTNMRKGKSLWQSYSLFSETGNGIGDKLLLKDDNIATRLSSSFINAKNNIVKNARKKEDDIVSDVKYKPKQNISNCSILSNAKIF